MSGRKDEADATRPLLYQQPTVSTYYSINQVEGETGVYSQPIDNEGDGDEREGGLWQADNGSTASVYEGESGEFLSYQDVMAIRDRERMQRNPSTQSLPGMADSGDFPSGISEYSTGGTRKPYIPDGKSAMASRYRYYSKLGGSGIDSLIVPAHVIPAHVLVPYLFQDGEKDGESGEIKVGKQKSWMTVFTIWNSLMGSSLLSLPWAFSQGGLITSILTMCFMGCFCLYTCLIIVRHGTAGKHVDLVFMVQKILGPVIGWITFAASVAVLLGSCVAYHILMSDALYSIVETSLVFIFGESVRVVALWTPTVAPLVVFVLLMLLVNLKSADIFVKINSLGVVCVVFNMGFIVYTTSFANTSHMTGTIFDNLHGIPQFNANFTFLSGISMLSFFLHNCVLPIVQNAEQPEHVIRDVAIGYSLAGFSYLLIGSLAFTAYWHGVIPQDFFDVFPNTYIPAFCARISLLLQLVTVFPLIAYIIRIQFFGMIYKSQYPSFLHVFVFNAVVVGVPTLFSMYYPQVGTVLRYLGGVCGFTLEFFVPIAIHWTLQRKESGEVTLFSYISHSLVMCVGLCVLLFQMPGVNPAADWLATTLYVRVSVWL